MQWHKIVFMLTTPSCSHLVSLECLAGGTAQFYNQQICDCISNLAKICSVSTGLIFADSLTNTLKSKMLLDRAGHQQFDSHFAGKRAADGHYWTEL